MSVTFWKNISLWHTSLQVLPVLANIMLHIVQEYDVISCKSKSYTWTFASKHYHVSVRTTMLLSTITLKWVRTVVVCCCPVDIWLYVFIHHQFSLNCSPIVISALKLNLMMLYFLKKKRCFGSLCWKRNSLHRLKGHFSYLCVYSLCICVCAVSTGWPPVQ